MRVHTEKSMSAGGSASERLHLRGGNRGCEREADSTPFWKRLLRVLPLATLAFGAPLIAAAGGGLNPSMRAADRPAEAADAEPRYVVTLRSWSPEAMAALRNAGGEILRQLPEVSAVAVQLPPEAINGLRSHPLIELIEVDAKRYPMSLWNDVAAGGEVIPYGIQMVQADQLIDVGTGTRTVCIIDSGFYGAHQDLQDSFVTASPDIGTGDPFLDLDGHGTHVAGTIAAIGANATGVRGVIQSQRLRLHIVKVFGDDGIWAYSSDLVAALTQCRNAGAQVVSMSLGGPSSVSAEQTAFNNAQTAGVLSIAAAGNDGSTRVSYPGGYSSVVSVAAVDADEVVADFSQKNSTVELAAPGVAVLSTVPYHEENKLTVGETTFRGNHIEFSGRSTGVTGLLVIGGLCGATSGSWSGKVVLCERGTYSFWEKVRNVQNSGGVAAVIYNNEPGNFFGTLDPNSSSIPAISLSQADGVAAAALAGASGRVVSLVQKPAFDGYDYFNGTSMATPHVSAVAALVWSYNPSWSNTQVRSALQVTAKDRGSAGKDNSYGYGIVQAKAALDYLCSTTGAGCAPPPAPPPPDPAVSCVTDTAESDFGYYAGEESNVDFRSSPGQVVLTSSGTTTTLDQQQTSTGCSSCPTITQTQWLAQTFVPSFSGRLTQADFSLFLGSSGTAGSIVVELRNTTAGAPGTTVLASTVLHPGSSGWYGAKFSSPATLTSGTSYALILRPNTGGPYAARRSNNNSYANGAYHQSTNGGSSWASQNSDLSFKTYVTTGTLTYATSGVFTSSSKDGTPGGYHSVEWNSISWNAASPISTEVRMQAAASNLVTGPFNYVGPDGTAATYFTSGASLAQFNGYRYLRYRALLSTLDSSVTPALDDVTVCHATVDAECSGVTNPVITPSPAQVCSGSTGNTASAPGGMSSYSWSITNGTITGGANTQTVTYTAGTSGNVTLHLNVLDSGCPASANLSVPIVQVTKPTISAGGPLTFCSGGSVTLTSSSTSGNQWLRNGEILQGETEQTYVASAAGAYTVVTTLSGCASPASDAATVTINTASDIPVISGSLTFCPDSSITLTAAATGASTYQWYRNGSIITDATANQLEVSLPGSYTATATNSCGTSDASTAHAVTEREAPTVTISGPATYCVGAPAVTLDAGGGFTSYLWSPGGATTRTIQISPNETTIYSVTVSDGTCTGTDSHEVTVSAPPAISITGPNFYCTGSAPIMLDAGAGFVSYLWSPGGATTRTIEVSPGETTTYSVTVSNGTCSASDTHGVIVSSTLAAPFGLAATATAPSAITVSWTAVAGASGYEVYRMSAVSPFSLLQTVAITGLVDSTVSSGSSYVYRVRAIGACGTSPFSASDVATTILFTDDPLFAGTTARAAHFTELRSAINAVRALAGLAPMTFTDGSLAGMVIRALHLQEMRGALSEARVVLGFPAPAYTDPVLTSGVTAVKAAHILELRGLVK
jgi:serine protease